jgi:hypothetical protein
MTRSRRAAAALGAASAVLLGVCAPAEAAPGTPGCPSSPSYDYTIPAPQGPPAATTLRTGGVGFSVLGRDRRFYWVETDIAVPGLAVAPLACFGGAGVDNPAAADYDAGVALFVRAPTGRIYANTVPDAAPGGTGWTLVPGGISASGPAAVLGSDGRLHLFVRGTNGALYTASRAVPSGAWSPFRSLGGGFVGTPAVAARPGGGFVAVVQAPAGDLYTRSATAAGAWGAWSRLPGAGSGGPALTGGYAAGRLDLFVVGTSGGLYQSTYTGGRFGAFKRVDGFPLPGTRVAAAATPQAVIVYITETGAETVTAYTRYAPGAGWSGYNRAPYTWPDGAPDASAGARGGATRPAVPAPLP